MQLGEWEGRKKDLKSCIIQGEKGRRLEGGFEKVYREFIFGVEIDKAG